MTDAPEPASPSLIDRRATGGLHNWRGMAFQLLYTLARVPAWLRDDAFEGFMPEGLDDVHAQFARDCRRVLDVHQVKRATVSCGDVRALVTEFRGRFAAEIAAGSVGTLTVATPYPTEELRHLFASLGDFRALSPAALPAGVAAQTRGQLRSRFENAGLVDEFEFVAERVHLFADIGGLEAAASPWPPIGADLAAVAGFDRCTVPELAHAVSTLADEVQRRPRHHWSRAEIVSVLHDAVENFRAGPPTASGDVVFLCHQSLAPVPSHPDASVLPAPLAGARIVRRTVHHERLGGSSDWDALGEEVASLFDPSGAFHQALAQGRTSPVVYYGFPHVPLAALAGYLFGETAHVLLVDHDRDGHRFAWASAPGPVPALAVARTDKGSRGIAVVRVSISARVAPELCVTFADDAVAIELDFSLEAPMRGLVLTEEQARAYAKVIRQTVDRFVGGNPDVTGIHVFAAVPVSVAFLIGQAAASTGYPTTYVYNFRQSDAPPYRWAICLQSAAQGAGVIMLPKTQRG